MSANARREGARRPIGVDVDPTVVDPVAAEAEEEVYESIIDETPEGRGPDRTLARREAVMVGVIVGLALLLMAGLLIAARPPYPVVLTVAVIGIMYAAASPVVIAMLLRRRDDVVAHERAHEIVEDMAHHGKPKGANE